MVAHLLWEQGAEGSNPFTQTMAIQIEWITEGTRRLDDVDQAEIAEYLGEDWRTNASAEDIANALDIDLTDNTYTTYKIVEVSK